MDFPMQIKLDPYEFPLISSTHLVQMTLQLRLKQNKGGHTNLVQMTLQLRLKQNNGGHTCILLYIYFKYVNIVANRDIRIHC